MSDVHLVVWQKVRDVGDAPLRYAPESGYVDGETARCNEPLHLQYDARRRAIHASVAAISAGGCR